MPGVILNTSKSLCLNTRKFSSPIEPIVILKGSQKARIYSAVGKVKLKETFHDNVLYIFNPSTP